MVRFFRFKRHASSLTISLPTANEEQEETWLRSRQPKD